MRRFLCSGRPHLAALMLSAIVLVLLGGIYLWRERRGR
jgi:hypothetical protein